MKLKISQFSIAICSLVILLLGGCSSNYPEKVYQGDTLPASEIVKLRVPEDITVISIDGKKMKSYLLDNIAIDYQLLPGKHEVVFKYSGVWAKPGTKKSDDQSNIELIESDPLMVSFNSIAGQMYTLQHMAPENRVAAKQFAASYSAILADEQGKMLTKAKPYEASSSTVAYDATVSSETNTAMASTADPMPSSHTEDMAPKSETPSSVPPAAVQNQLAPLDGLKLLWNKASKEDKKAFLEWAFK